MQKGQGLIFVIVGILVAAIIAGGAYYLGRSTSPKPSPAPVVSQTPQSISTPTQNSLKPADSQTPTAGICTGPVSDVIVTVTFGLDNVANPRCTKVASNQKLKIINNSNQTISGKVGQYTINIQPNHSQNIDATFGLYLAPGVHKIAGAEIWLQ